MSKDFRVGDTVCCAVHGNGVVEQISPYNLPIMVKWENAGTVSYLSDGRLNANDTYPTVYIGSYDDVFGEVLDVVPTRKVTVWMNLYLSGSDVLLEATQYATEELALASTVENIIDTISVEVDA